MPLRLIDSLVDFERESLARAMTTVDSMTEGDRRAVVAHAVAASIRYATQRENATLHDWCRSLLRTLRVAADPEYQRARARTGQPRGVTWDIAEGAICVEAAKHEADVIRGGCICGFGIWSAEHVAVMAFREVARHLRPKGADL